MRDWYYKKPKHNKQRSEQYIINNAAFGRKRPDDVPIENVIVQKLFHFDSKQLRKLREKKKLRYYRVDERLTMYHLGDLRRVERERDQSIDGMHKGRIVKSNILYWEEWDVAKQKTFG